MSRNRISVFKIHSNGVEVDRNYISDLRLISTIVSIKIDLKKQTIYINLLYMGKKSEYCNDITWALSRAHRALEKTYS